MSIQQLLEELARKIAAKGDEPRSAHCFHVASQDLNSGEVETIGDMTEAEFCKWLATRNARRK